MTIDEALEERHRHTTYVKWAEPWPYLTVNGNERSGHVEYRATVHDIIGIQRHINRGQGHSELSERDLLVDFIVVHWADLHGDV